MGIYEKLGVRRVVNAAGTITTLGGSIMEPETLEAMNDAATSFVYMDELIDKAGNVIAEITGSEAAFVTSGATAGLALATAACMTGKDFAKMRRLPDTSGMKNEVIIEKGHRNRYDVGIRMTGARIIEVGDIETQSWEVEAAVNEKTAAIVYVLLDPQPFMLSLEEIIRIGKKHDVPVIADVAAELPPVENLKKFIDMRVDLVVFSGGKGIRGPNDSGFICGRKDLIEACALQGFPRYGIGRAMKISREQIVGLVIALQKFVRRDHEADMRRWTRMAKYMAEELRGIPHIEVELVFPERGSRPLAMPRPLCIPRVRLTLDEKRLGVTVNDAAESFRKEDPCVEVWAVPNLGEIYLNPQCLLDSQEKIVVERIKKILTII